MGARDLKFRTDCDLAQHKGSPFDWSCIVKSESGTAVITVQEFADSHGIRRIVLDGKGNETRKRWVEELLDLGFREAFKGQEAWTRLKMISADTKTQAELVWIEAQKSISIVITPRDPPQPKAKVSDRED